MPDLPRLTATLVRDEPSGALFLQGREEFTPHLANIFGNGRFKPVCRAFDKQIVFEAEVRFHFSEHADDDPTDSAEVYSFRIWSWSITPEGPQASLMHGSWEDFQADDPPGEAYGWDVLLTEAVGRLREARAARRSHEALPIRLVGGPPAPVDLIDTQKLVTLIEVFLPEQPDDGEDDRTLDLRIHYADGRFVEHEAASLRALTRDLTYAGYELEWLPIGPHLMHCVPVRDRAADTKEDD